MEKLRELRKKNGYTHQQMGDMLNISKIYYWQIENDKRRLYYEMAARISKIFNLKPDDIFYEELKKGD
jgi:DNA-binding XRE family transcriptional regulator